MSRRLPMFTSAGGITYEWEDDGAGGGYVHATQPVGEILDHNQALYNSNDGYNAARDLRRVGSIPLSLITLWQTVEGWNPYDPANQDRLTKKLNSIDYLKLRTAPGVIGYSNGVMR